LPRHSELAPLLAKELEHSSVTSGLRRLCAVEPAADHLCACYVARAFQGLGVTFEPGEFISSDRLRACVVEQHRRVVDPYLALLEADRVLVCDGEGWRRHRGPAATRPELLWRSIYARL